MFYTWECYTWVASMATPSSSFSFHVFFRFLFYVYKDFAFMYFCEPLVCHIAARDQMHVLCKNKNSNCSWVICLSLIFIHLLKLKNYLRECCIWIHSFCIICTSLLYIFPAIPFQSCDLVLLSLLHIHLTQTHNLSPVMLPLFACI